ncbi:type 2 lanthipeptide synthetase LanM [Ornithinicoccus hortensis]|uniref:Type 2 lantibiotic biosynthesis protein LanM n=1 Tax=Ornithinicoccus hortensis TaxID=82346 RepID=A0A542YTX4_9MICO|nr:type 2 lanthipeptide synthetase LanM [Ornithinicoccus hortensis]TQL51543.1 type 2 lantibiotic biosynthesis protein LanM [Ornithinicoccus hortensis]
MIGTQQERRTDPAPGTTAQRCPDLPWWRAATLSERLAAPGTPTVNDRDRQDFRISRWRSLPAFSDAESEDTVLRPLGVSASDLWGLLGEDDDSLRRRLEEVPDWVADFERFWTLGQDRAELPPLGLLEVLRPLLEGALREFVTGAEGLAEGQSEEIRQSVDSLVQAVVADPPVEYLHMMCSPVLVLELNVARVEERLGDGTPEERYAAFVSLLQGQEGRAALLSEYVVLTRFVTTRLRYWVERRLELVRAYLEDLPELSGVMWQGQVPRFTRVEFGAGDSHRKGRSVAILATDSTKVVYKPRDVALDRAFDRLLAWTNDHLTEAPLRRVTTVGRADRTWVEFIDSSRPTDEAGADRYARRLGRLTALLYALHSTDFHFENVMASGDDPVLVDLEALLHVEPIGAGSRPEEKLVNAAATVLGESIRSIGILPDRILVNQDDESYAVDVSAIGGHGGQQGLVEVPTLVDAGRDTMRIDAQRHTVPAQANAPTAESGEVFDLVQREGPFLQGFEETHRLLEEHADELVSEDGPLAGFAGAVVRHIARPTFLYGRLLLKSMHPDFQRDALDQLMYLGKLLNGHRGRPDRIGVIRAEFEDLLVGDVPIFGVSADTGELFAGDAEVPLGRRTEPPTDIVRARINALDTQDRRRQMEIATYSFVAASIDGEVDKWPGWSRPRPAAGASREQVVEAAHEIARTLCDSAVERDGHLGWIGLNLVDERWWTLSPTSMDLYAGVPGIALALSAVASVGGDDRVVEYADRAMGQVASQAAVMAELSAGQVAKRGVAGMDAGAFGIVGGTMYALATAATLRDRADWGDAAAGLLDTLGKLVQVDDNADIVSGSAGALLAALAVAPFAPTPALEVAHCAADRLRETAQGLGEGELGWISPVSDGQPLVGLSHGTLGIALALARLHEADSGADVGDLIAGALAHEDQHFDSQSGDSADLRTIATGRGGAMRAWCHGAGGGALGRGALLRHQDLIPDPDRLTGQRDLAVRALWDTGLAGASEVRGIGNHCLCHGDVGNLLAATHSGAAPHADTDTTLLALVESGSRDGWLCGVPRGVHTPGLMTGTAGIAWGLAFAASGGAMPNVLTLESAEAVGEVNRP